MKARSKAKTQSRNAAAQIFFAKRAAERLLDRTATEHGAVMNMSRDEVAALARQLYDVSSIAETYHLEKMTAKEIGMYLLLLFADWNGDGFDFDEESLARMCRVSRATFQKAWTRLSRCFVADQQGRYRNPRLQAERVKQEAWREKSSEGGKVGSAKRWEGHTKKEDEGGHKMVTPDALPNDDIPFPSSTTDSTTTTKPKTTTSPRAVAPRENWLVPVSRVWESRFGAGSFDFGKNGKHLKRLKEHHQPGVIAEHLGRFLEKADPQYVSIARFVDTFAQYAAHDPSALVDEYGCLTPLGEKETRPAGLRVA
jgi:uncharacterized protein YdaU (DUF1376 family)